MSPTFRVRSTHPVDIACGQMVGPGESTPNVDPKQSHDKRLIEEGTLVELASKRPPQKKQKQE
jgi:hypothetical protein